MSRDQWHPRPAVRALVRLWTKLFAGRWGAWGWSLDPQARENMDSVPRRGSSAAITAFSPHSLSGCFCHQQSANLYVHVFCLHCLLSPRLPASEFFWSFSAGGRFISALRCFIRCAARAQPLDLDFRATVPQQPWLGALFVLGFCLMTEAKGNQSAVSE